MCPPFHIVDVDIIAHPDNEEWSAVAVAVVAPGCGADHRNREVLVRDEWLVQLLPVTSDWVPDNEFAPLQLLKENTPMATVEGDPGATVQHRVGKGGW
jgi:hypothetical protein